MGHALEVQAIPLAEVGSDAIVFSKDEFSYWHDDPPQAIVLASSSVRKAILVCLALAEYNPDILQSVPFLEQLPFDPSEAKTPLAFQELLEKHIPNGDGVLSSPIFIGVFHGVPVYMVPQQGETDRNDDPMAEAENKVRDVHQHLSDKRVVIIGADTTGSVNGEHLGKPRNLKEPVGNFERGFASVDEMSDQSLAQFSSEYLDRFYSGDLQLRHNSALYVLRNGETTKVVQRTTELKMEETALKEHFDHLRVFLEASGGGIFQQLIHWTDDVLEQLKSDQRMYDWFAKLTVEERRWQLIVHIMGVPAWMLHDVFEELAGNSQPS